MPQLNLKTFDKVDVCEVQTYPENVPLIPHDPQDYAHHKPNMFHGKVMSPWQIREKSGVEFIWTSPAWHQKDPLKFHPNEVARFAKDILRIKEVTVEVFNTPSSAAQNIMVQILDELKSIRSLLEKE